MKSRFMNVASVALVSMVSAAACGASLTLGEPNLVGDQLTVPVTVGGYSGGTLELLIGEAGPRDGEPDATTSAASREITADGTYNLTAQVSVGAKIAYRAALGSDDSLMGVITATDNVQYIWVTGNSGNWHDPANWTRDSNDGYKNIGYPAYSTGAVRFLGNQTAEVTLDADYEGFGDFFIDNKNLNLTIHGNGHALKTGNTHTTSDNTFVFDNVKYTTSGSYTVGSRSSAKLINGTYFQTQWQFNVNGSGSAYLYVGPGCEINAGVGDGGVYTFRLDGEGNTIEIEDGYIHSRGFLIGSQREGAAPGGIVFKGSSPRMEFGYEFVVCKKLTGYPVLDFYVPVGGYAQAPIFKTRSGDFPALDNKWIDHTSSTSVYSPVAFKINDRSPFYQSESTLNTCLFDWSASTQGIRDGSFVFLDAQESSPSDYEYARKQNAGCETEQDQVWAHLTGRGIPADLPSIASSATVSADGAVLTIVGEVTSLSSTFLNKVQLWIGMVGGDGDAEGAMQLVDTIAVTSTGAFQTQYTAKLGAKVACKLVIVGEDAESGNVWANGGTSVITKTLADNAEYYWKDNTTGTWSDPDNWTYTDDGTPRLGYPSNGGKFHFRGNSSYTVYVDGYYSGFGWNNEIGWGGADITFVGTVDNAYVSGISIECYNNIKTTLDNVTCRFGSYWAHENSGLTLTNNATMNSVWAGGIDGENAYVYVGSNCTFATGVGENWHIGTLTGKNSTFTVDNGTFSAAAMTIGSGESASAPFTLRFMGKNAKMECKVYLKNVNAVEGSSRVEFSIPEGGYAATPITKGGDDNTAFLAPDEDGREPICVTVMRTSPYLKVRGNFTQQLVDWTRNNTSYQIDTAGVTFAKMPRDKERMYFTPESGDVKSGIAVDCKGKQGLTITLR